MLLTDPLPWIGNLTSHCCTALPLPFTLSPSPRGMTCAGPRTCKGACALVSWQCSQQLMPQCSSRCLQVVARSYPPHPQGVASASHMGTGP